MDTQSNKSFCAMPFVSIMLNTDASMRFCCIAQGPGAKIRKRDNTVFQAGTDSISEAWNSEYMKNIRQSMIAGESISACKHCYMQEEIGKKSLRQMMTEEWQRKLGDNFKHIVKNAVENDFYLEIPPVYLDLRLGNLCNLKCRMCNPFNSSQIAKEHFSLYDDNQEYRDLWSSEFGKNPTHLKEDMIEFDSDFLWDEIIEMIPHLSKVYMTGGEPTLIENNYRFMEKCIEKGYSKDIELFFNINCTNVTDKFLDLLSKFKIVGINCSLDGFEEVNDYIRYPSRWTKVKENFEKLCKLPNLNLNITPVIQTYNVFDCHNMLWYAEEASKKYNKDIGVDFLINNHPEFLDVTILPKEVRQKGKNNLEYYKENSERYHRNFLVKNSVDSVINLFDQPTRDNSDQLLENFKKMTKIYDSKRKQKFEDMIPELAKALNYESTQ